VEPFPAPPADISAVFVRIFVIRAFVVAFEPVDDSLPWDTRKYVQIYYQIMSSHLSWSYLNIVVTIEKAFIIRLRFVPFIRTQVVCCWLYSHLYLWKCVSSCYLLSDAADFFQIDLLWRKKGLLRTHLMRHLILKGNEAVIGGPSPYLSMRGTFTGASSSMECPCTRT
jgi:hypothetical protein